MQKAAAELKNGGGTLDDFLKDEGIYEEVHLRVVKRILARNLRLEMDKMSITKVEMARRMGTGRASLNRLLDDKHNVTLETISKAAAVLGKCLKIELVDQNDTGAHAC